MNKKDENGSPTNPYKFPTTSKSLIVIISTVEGWRRFCERYAEPIKNVLNAINNRRKGRLLRPEEVDDAFGVIIEKLNKKLQTSYDPERGRLRKWLSTVIRNAIFDYCKEREEGQKHLLQVPACSHDGAGDEAADAKTLIENIPDKPTAYDKEWDKFLQITALNMAEVSRPWSARDKEVIKVIKDELTKEKTERRSGREIASSFKITADNFRQICRRYKAEVRKQYDEFKQDDPDFFDAMKKYSIPFDVLLDEYLKMVGGEEGLAERREKFKDRHLLG